MVDAQNVRKEALQDSRLRRGSRAARGALRAAQSSAGDESAGRRSWSFSGVLVTGALLPGVLLAQPQNMELSGGPSIAYLLLKVVVALVVTGGFAYLTVALMRRFLHPRASGGLSDEVRLVGSLGLAPKKQIFLVRCFDRLLVIGATESQMTLLCEVTDPELIAEVDRRPRKAGETRLGSSLLKNLNLQ